MICSMCGSEFDPEVARDEFEDEHGDMSYDNFYAPHCYECAHEVIENCVDGHYFEYCDRCNKKFDWFAEDSDFMLRSGRYDNADLPTIKSYTGQILCSDCAMDYMAEEFPHGGGF